MHALVLQRKTGRAPYEQIRDHLRQQIASGEIDPAVRLPSVRSLAAMHSVSPVTAQKALRELRLEGLTVARHGRGTFAAPARLRKPGSPRRNELAVERGVTLRNVWPVVLNRFSALHPETAVRDQPIDGDVREVTLDMLPQQAPTLEDITDLVCECYERREDTGTALDRFRVNGRFHAFPVSVNAYTMAVNLDLFERLGVPVPSPGWNWDDMRRAAEALTRPAAGTYGVVSNKLWDALLPPLWQAGGAVFSQDGEECLLDRPAALEAGRFMRALAPATMPDRPDQSHIAAYLKGNAGMIICGVWGYAELMRQRRFRWTVLPVPRGEKRVSLLYGYSYGISRRTALPEVARDFVRTLAEHELTPTRLEQRSALPFHSSLEIDGPVERIYREALEITRTPLSDIDALRRRPVHALALQRLNQCTQSLLTGSEPVEEVMRATAEDIRKFISERGNPLV